MSSRRVQITQNETVGPIREFNAATQPLLEVQADLQQMASAVQSARAFTQAYNRQREALLEAIASVCDQIRVAVEQQLRLEKPWNYESREPHPAAKTTADEWCTRFLGELDDILTEMSVDQMDQNQEPFAKLMDNQEVQEAITKCPIAKSAKKVKLHIIDVIRNHGVSSMDNYVQYFTLISGKTMTD